MLTLELQARSIVFESGEGGGGQTYPKILDQPKNIKKSLEQFSSVGGGGCST